MPTTELADKIHAKGYRSPNEDFREWAGRVAAHLKDDDDHYHELRAALYAQRILPGGRIQAGAGSPRRVTLLNCYVMPTIEDSFVDGEDSIHGVAGKTARTMRMGGGCGLEFSQLRPRGSRINTLGSQASGPVSFMGIYDSYCRATASAGNRRGALMGVLRVDHPDVEEFVRSKQNNNMSTGFNISLGVTDEFMRALESGDRFPLRWGGQSFEDVSAAALWEEVMRSAWDWAEPGVLFVDTINRMNNLWYCEKIVATNPCGEQPLPPNGACLLGSLCLPKYVCGDGLDWDLMARDLRTFVRALDNVLDRTDYPLDEQRREAMAKRRMGIGVTGLANAIEALGAPYGSPLFLEIEAQIMQFVRDRAYTESAVLAAERGAFPAFRREEYLDGEFVRRLPPAVRDLIAHNGIRNSHLTSVAPTGTISLCADNVSSGVEPVFSYEVERDVRWNDRVEKHRLTDYGLREFGVRGRTTAECSMDEHLAVLATAQHYVDSAVSKTVNASPDTPWEDFKDLYRRAWDLGCKGLAVYVPPTDDGAGGKRDGIMCAVDPDSGVSVCDA